MTMELHLIERSGLVQQLGSGTNSQSLFKMRHTLAERQVEKKLNETDQVAASATPMAIEQILAGIDVEGRAAFLVQWAQPYELLRWPCRASCPVVLLQVFQQRNPLFEPLKIGAHDAVFVSMDERRRRSAVFPGKDGGRPRLLNSQGPKPGEKQEDGLPVQWQ